MPLKKIFFLIVLMIVQEALIGQEFVISEEYKITKINYKNLMKIESLKKDFDGYMPIFVKDKKGKVLKKIKTYAESYENDSYPEILKTPNLLNVKDVLRINISSCACYCNTTTYHFLILNNGTKVELPVIEDEDYELTMKFSKYKFPKDNSNKILLIEYQDEIIKKGIYSKKNIKRKSEKILKTLIWDGKKITYQ